MDVSSDPRVYQTVAALTQAYAGTPWVVRPTPEGAVVSLDIVDARWWEAIRRVGLRQAYSFTVRFDPEVGTCSITDELRTLRWQAGIDGRMRPVLGAAATAQRGRIMTYRKEFVITPMQGKVVDFTFSSEEGRAPLRGVLDEYGWQEKMGGTQKVGLWFAIGGIAVALIGVAVALLVAL